MKLKAVSLIFLFAIFASFIMAQDHTKEDAFAKQIFLSLQNNDYASFKKLYPSFDEYKELMQMMLDAGMADLTKEKVAGFLEDYKRESDSTYHAEFNKLINQADSVGVKWKEASFVKFEFVSAYPDNFSRKYLNGDIHFSCGKSSFIVGGIEGVELPSSYKIQEVKEIRRE